MYNDNKANLSIKSERKNTTVGKRIRLKQWKKNRLTLSPTWNKKTLDPDRLYKDSKTMTKDAKASSIGLPLIIAAGLFLVLFSGLLFILYHRYTTLSYDLPASYVRIPYYVLAAGLFIMLLILFASFLAYLIYSQKRELANRESLMKKIEAKARKEFLTNMSHDIRTPMNAIVGYTNLALNNSGNENIVRDYLAKVQISSDHLMALINDMLDMSDIESGGVTLEETPCCISDIMYELNSMMIQDTEKKNQGLRIDINGVRDNNIYCDRMRLNQIMINLLSNANKFTPDGGEITVQVLQKEKAPEGYGAYEIHVKDNGIGMSPEFATKVFEPFEREKTSTISGVSGTGLGISITKNIVELMHGKIDLITVPKKGTEFIISINFRLQKNQNSTVRKNTFTGTVPAAEESPSVESGINFEGKRILLVDDVEINREIARTLLEMHGFEIEEAVNGEEAVNMVIQSEADWYDVILMDIQMPVMDGYEATKVIRALDDETRAEIPILAMTANVFDEDKRLSAAAGMNGHLSKPIDIAQLIAALKQVLY